MPELINIMRINWLKRLFAVLALGFALASCTEPYDIELEDSFTRLVVDGFISVDTTSHRVKLTTTSSYFANEQAPAVSGAQVFVDDGIQRVQLNEIPSGSGDYFTPDDYYGFPGRTYVLEINLQDEVGGQSFYRAETYLPPAGFVIDSIVVERQFPFEFFLVNLYAFDPPTTDFYKFDLEINGILVTDTASRSVAIDDRIFNGNNTNGFGVVFLFPDEVVPGDTMNFIMSAIDEDYYRFLIELRSESGFSNPLFSGPPANIRSNISDGGLGYFGARHSKRLKYIVPESVLGN